MQKYKIQTSWLERSLVRVAKYHRYGMYKGVKKILEGQNVLLQPALASACSSFPNRPRSTDLENSNRNHNLARLKAEAFN